jgi:CDP-diacylglycerol--serine O-phosphatidyltransferase
VLLPIYLSFLSVQAISFPPLLTFFYTLLIGGLMVSRLPVFSGKKVGTRVRPDLVLPLFVVAVAICALFISYPWEVLTVSTLAFLVTLPLSWMAYQKHLRADEEARAVSGAEDRAPPAEVLALRDTSPQEPSSDDDRPARLN